jgi:pteridine reductase
MNKVALITGAARRIGAGIAEKLHAEGMNVIIHYRNSAEEAAALVEKLNHSRKNSALMLQADLHQTAKLPALILDAQQCWGRLDALINNASTYYPTPLGDVDEASWDELLGSNLKSPFFLAQAAALHLAKQQGCIVNITDINAMHPRKGYSVYCAAKAGLQMLTKSLAQELSPAVRVNAVAPGPILWPEHKSQHDAAELMPRVGTPADVAQAVWYFLEAVHVTGQVIAVDGGLSI